MLFEHQGSVFGVFMTFCNNYTTCKFTADKFRHYLQIYIVRLGTMVSLTVEAPIIKLSVFLFISIFKTSFLYPDKCSLCHFKVRFP